MTTTRKVDYTEYATRIVRAIPEGVLLTTRAQDRLDTMTIGWGALGTNWSVPVFEAFVRTGRHTARMLEENPELLEDWDPVCGDRMTKICVIGRGMDKDALVAGLDRCLVDWEPETEWTPAD